MHLALRGGLLFSRSLMRWANQRGMLGLSEKDTYADEVLGFAVAIGGFWSQLEHGFAVPFPLNIVFLPLTIIEWFLRFQISMESTAL